jgi:uncharacterized membrane protein YbhN (UPF0104 family)
MLRDAAGRGHTLIPGFASYQDVWDALTSLQPVVLLLLTVLTLVMEGCKAGAFDLMIKPLRFSDAFLAQEAAAVISNTVPGPSPISASVQTAPGTSDCVERRASPTEGRMSGST